MSCFIIYIYEKNLPIETQLLRESESSMKCNELLHFCTFLLITFLRKGCLFNTLLSFILPFNVINIQSIFFHLSEIVSQPLTCYDRAAQQIKGK